MKGMNLPCAFSTRYPHQPINPSNPFVPSFKCAQQKYLFNSFSWCLINCGLGNSRALLLAEMMRHLLRTENDTLWWLMKVQRNWNSLEPASVWTRLDYNLILIHCLKLKEKQKAWLLNFDAANRHHATWAQRRGCRKMLRRQLTVKESIERRRPSMGQPQSLMLRLLCN